MAQVRTAVVGIGRRERAGLIRGLIVAAGMCVPAAQSIAQIYTSPPAARGADGQTIEFLVPVAITDGLDLSGQDGADGHGGLYYLTPNNEVLSSAQPGGNGGDGGSLILAAGGLISLNASAYVDLSGGTGGQGGTAMYAFPWPPRSDDIAPDGVGGRGGDLILGGPSTLNLAGSATINASGGGAASLPYDLSTNGVGGFFYADALNSTLRDNSRLVGFSTMRLRGASQMTVRDNARLTMQGRRLQGGGRSVMRVDEGSTLRVQGGEVEVTSFELDGSILRIAGGRFSTSGEANDANTASFSARASYVEVTDGQLEFEPESIRTFSEDTIMRVTGGEMIFASSRGLEVPTIFDDSKLEMYGGRWAGAMQPVRATNGAEVNLLGGVVELSQNSYLQRRVDTAYTADDSIIRIGQNNAGPDITLALRPEDPAIQLRSSTLDYNAGRLDLRGMIRLSQNSTFRVHAGNFETGYVSGGLDWQSGSVIITNSYAELGSVSALGRLLGGDNTVISTGQTLTATSGVGIRQTALLVENGGSFGAGTLVGLGTGAFGNAAAFSIETSSGSAVKIDNNLMTASLSASATTPGVIRGDMNLAGGQLSIRPTVEGAEPRAAVVVTGSATNGTILLPGGTSTAASVALTTLNGDANLRVNGSASQVEARVSDVRLGGLSGTGGVRLEGTNTFAASGQHTYAGTLSGPGALTLNGTGAQTFSASSVRTGSTSISGGGTVTMGTNTSLGSGAITVNGATLKAAAPLSLSNTLRIGSDGATFDTAGVSVTTTGSISAVSGNGGPVTITGGGEWVRSTSAAYAGGTTITGGTTARITVGNALGLGTLRLDNGTVKANSSTLTATNPTQLGAGGGTLDAAGQLVIWSGGISPVSGVNDGGLHVRGGGFVYLTQPNTYTGGTRITANTTAVVDTGAAFGTGPITLDSGIIQPTQFVVGRAGIRLGAGGGRIDTAGQQVFWNFPITTAPGVTNDGGLTITGGGSFQLNAASTYRGNTTLLAGTLNLTNTTGSATGTGSVLVQGGMLTGNGRIGSNALVSMLMSSGSIAPGTGAGTLTFGGLGALAFHGGELVMELGSQSDLITFDTLGDRVRGYGTTLRIVPTAGFSPTQSYPIFSNVMDAGNLFAFASIVGVDPSLQPSVTYDAVQQSYVVSFIPSPGAVALMGVGCVMASRRRRG